MSTVQNTTPIPPNFVAKQMWASTIVYTLLTIITGGLYFYYFQYKLDKLMKRMNMEGEVNKLHKWFSYSMIIRLIWIVVVFVVAFASRSGEVTPLLRLILIPAMVFEVLWSFKARSILSLYFADKYKVLINPHGIFLFFFPGISLTWMMNQVENEVALLKALRDTQ